MGALEKTIKAKALDAPATKRLSAAPAYDAEGRQVNRRESLDARGCVAGTKVCPTRDVGVEEDGKAGKMS